MNRKENDTAAAARICLDAIDATGFEIDFDPDDLKMRDRPCFEKIALTAASFMTDEDDSDNFLSVEIYRGRRDYIVDVVRCVGGPTVRARYESYREEITVKADWEADHLEFTSRRCPLIDWIQMYVEADDL